MRSPQRRRRRRPGGLAPSQLLACTSARITSLSARSAPNCMQRPDHVSSAPMARASSAGSQATKRSQTAKATLGVRELVLDGGLAPGERVPEVALAGRLGVSRTPLRIALATLAHEGLLEPLRGGGFV